MSEEQLLLLLAHSSAAPQLATLTPTSARWVPGGHVTSFLLHHSAFRQAVVDSLAKLAQPPPLRTAASADEAA